MEKIFLKSEEKIFNCALLYLRRSDSNNDDEKYDYIKREATYLIDLVLPNIYYNQVVCFRSYPFILYFLILLYSFLRRTSCLILWIIDHNLFYHFFKNQLVANSKVNFRIIINRLRINHSKNLIHRYYKALFYIELKANKII